MNKAQAIYTCTNVAQQYSGRTVLDIPHLEVTAGQMLGIVGANGSGKSTLIKLLAFLELPSKGTVTYAGHNSRTVPLAIRRDVTLLPQEPFLLRRSIRANLAFGRKLRGLNTTDKEIATALHSVCLDPERFIKRQWWELSGGEAQRVALAARLILQPRVLLMDEPTASLDEASARHIQEAVRSANKQHNMCVVVISHDRFWLDPLIDSCIHLQEGKIRE